MQTGSVAFDRATGQYRFTLADDELVKIGAIPYRHIGGGVLEGATNPRMARALRDADEAAENEADEE